MQISLYSASVPVFKQMLNSLGAILVKAEAYALDKKIEPNALLQARLYPDMFPTIRQVQIATEFARGVSARLAGVEVPVVANDEQAQRFLFLFGECLIPGVRHGAGVRLAHAASHPK